jgi:hypothetical protein
MSATAALAAHDSAPIKRGDSDGGSTNMNRRSPCEVIPFPHTRRVAWIDEKLDIAGCRPHGASAIKYLDTIIENRIGTMRKQGIAEDRIQRDLAPVRHKFNTWLANSIWPNEPGYNSVG